MFRCLKSFIYDAKSGWGEVEINYISREWEEIMIWIISFEIWYSEYQTVVAAQRGTVNSPPTPQCPRPEIFLFSEIFLHSEIFLLTPSQSEVTSLPPGWAPAVLHVPVLSPVLILTTDIRCNQLCLISISFHICCRINYSCTECKHINYLVTRWNVKTFRCIRRIIHYFSENLTILWIFSF